MKFAIMDNCGIIEDFDNLDTAIESIERVREEETIVGDIKVIEIHYISN